MQQPTYFIVYSVQSCITQEPTSGQPPGTEFSTSGGEGRGAEGVNSRNWAYQHCVEPFETHFMTSAEMFGEKGLFTQGCIVVVPLIYMPAMATV
jgi:hypothetical protein